MISVEMLKKKKWIFGMVHLAPLPGSPKYNFDNEKIIKDAIDDADKLISGGVDGIIIENYGDWPFTKKVNLSQIMVHTIISYKIREKYPDIPLGINFHYNVYDAEAHLASTVGADFVRVEVFVDTVIYDDGILYPVSADVLRLRKQLNASFLIFADIQPKHTELLVPRSIKDSAHAAERAMADAVIVTGKETGSETPIELIKQVKEAVNIPILVGSGTTPSNVLDILNIADGAIVGSYFKYNGYVFNHVDEVRVKNFMKEVRRYFK